MPLPAQRPASAPSPARTGALLIGATCLGSGIALAAGRQLLLKLAPPLTPATSPAALERIRHQSVDPLRRRDAALLLSSDPQRTAQQRRQLLQGQGWGRSALAATALKQAAQAASASGAATEATALWQLLLQRFPHQAASADALYALGGGSPALRRQLLQRFPAHPAALAAALEAGDALHLARWGARWPGAEALLLSACAHDCVIWPDKLPAPPQVPPLPATARQPAQIPECSPTCSAGWTRLVESLLR